MNRSTISFLKDLEKNNNRDWFKKNRKRYDDALADINGFTSELIGSLCKVNPALKTLSPKDCIFRIYRDIRFSSNKDPYKTHFGVVISEGGRKSQAAGFYIQVAARDPFIAGGAWMPQPGDLKKIRQEIDYNFDTFKKIISNRSFRNAFGEITGERLRMNPKGYDPGNPAIDYLKMKSFIVEHKLRVSQLTGKTLVSDCNKVYRSMMPLLQFLNEAIS